MKIISLFSYYSAHGGEEEVFLRESALLQQGGHTVWHLTARNRDMADWSPLKAAASTVWNPQAARQLGQMLAKTGAEIVHVHNFFAALSPCVLRAAHAAGAAVVMTLHNYRMFCVNGMLFRDGTPCTCCIGAALPWRGVVGACYSGQHSASAVVAAMNAVHGLAGTFRTKVHRYILPSPSLRRICLAGGMDGDQLVVKPNFAPDLHQGQDLDGPRSGGLYVGRMTIDKGVALLAQAWQGVDVPLLALGDGELRSVFGGGGACSLAEVAQAMRRAAFLVVPSLWLEPFGLVVIEAFSAGLPVIVAGHGALADLVEDGQSGLHFRPGDAGDLRCKIDWAIQNPHLMRQMGRRGRQVYERLYSPGGNLAALERIYEDALRARSNSQ